MELSMLMVENFRNYQNTSINLSNKNVVFGVNDVGKTNLLYSLRFLLDRKIRINGFEESDYYQRDTTKPIKITLKVDLSDRENQESQQIISQVKGARTNNNLKDFYFQVIGEYEDVDALGIPMLYWGNSLESLTEVPSSSFDTSLDRLFNLVYIDASIDMENIFSRNQKRLFNERKLSTNDILVKNEIDGLTSQMNDKIGSMEIMEEFQDELTEEYHQLKKEDITIELQSEMAIKGFFSDIYPYIKREGEENLYPTSGDGRKKLLAYSLVNHLTKKYDSNRITIYLIEEPENNLHRSMQIALSQQLFNQDVYQYFILSTHSSELLYEMDDATLIRVYSQDKTDCESYLYEVSNEFSTIKKELNQDLTTALFSDRVLLIEGPSEKILFEKVLSVVNPTYELEGGYLLLVDGIKFKPYFETLTGLNITPIVKTDNDLKAKRGNKICFDTIGFNRCFDLLNKPKMDAIEIDYSFLDSEGALVYCADNKKKMIKEKKENIYDNNPDFIRELNDKNIFISKIDLENDLYEVLPDKMVSVFGDNPIETMQDRKLINMIDLITELDSDDCHKIFEHKRFKVLRKLVKS